jgi:hypothetical protein
MDLAQPVREVPLNLLVQYRGLRLGIFDKIRINRVVDVSTSKLLILTRHSSFQ